MDYRNRGGFELKNGLRQKRPIFALHWTRGWTGRIGLGESVSGLDYVREECGRMPLAFGGQFAKTIIERHEVEGRGEQKSRAQRAEEEHLQIEIEERSRSKKWRRRGCGACKKGRAEGRR